MRQNYLTLHLKSKNGILEGFPALESSKLNQFKPLPIGTEKKNKVINQKSKITNRQTHKPNRTLLAVTTIFIT